MRNFFKMLGLLIIVSTTACGSMATNNIKGTGDLKKGDKILVGRFSCYKNDVKTGCYDNKNIFVVDFNENNDKINRTFVMDKEGYVYTALPSGQYNLNKVRMVQGFGGDFAFSLNPMPTVTIKNDDSVVNFGTIELRFYQTTGSKIGATLAVGIGYLNAVQVKDYDVAASYISSKLGADIISSARNADVIFLNRAN